MSDSLAEILTEYLGIRKWEGEECLFPTVCGGILSRTSLQKAIVKYCKERGIEKQELHAHRYTFITRSVERNISLLISKSITRHSKFKQLNHYYNSKHQH